MRAAGAAKKKKLKKKIRSLATRGGGQEIQTQKSSGFVGTRQ